MKKNGYDKEENGKIKYTILSKEVFIESEVYKKHEEHSEAKTPLVSIRTTMNHRPWKIVSGGQTGVDRGWIEDSRK